MPLHSILSVYQALLIELQWRLNRIFGVVSRLSSVQWAYFVIIGADSVY